MILWVGGLSICSLTVQPMLADKPLEGEARPPHHVRGNVTTGPTGLFPAQIRKFYGLDQITNQGAGQTIAIIDAYDDPNIESDLGVFSTRFGLPACTTGNGCFQKMYASGSKPVGNSGWGLEIALDVEWAHAIAPQAKILLVEAASASFTDLLHAVDVAVWANARVVSMSFGGNEFSSETYYDYHFAVPGVTFTASSGDSGNGVEYPAVSPYVIAVGGTTAHMSDAAGTYSSETAWSGSGGGRSVVESKPMYQLIYGVSWLHRAVPDVAYDADPNSGFPVYDTFSYQGQAGWFQVGGTSAGAPQWAAMFAIANSIRVANFKPTLSSLNSVQYALYNASTWSANFHDIASGANGTCGSVCLAGANYDFVTGLGSPKANQLIPALAQY